MDWISPTVYAKYDAQMFPSLKADEIRAPGRAWRAAEIGLAKLIGAGKPVIPTVCPWWTVGGRAPVNRLIGRREFLEDQVIPSLAMGADGIAYWNALSYISSMVTASPTNEGKYPSSGDGSISAWRKAIQDDYFGGAPVDDWSGAAVRQLIPKRLSQSMLTGIRDLIDWERAGTKPR
jgi:hypothetical protein